MKQNFCRALTFKKMGGLSAQGIHKLSVSRQNNMHLCESCYFQFCDWFGEGAQKMDPLDVVSCEHCKHVDKKEYDYPCLTCKHDYTDKFEPKENAE